MDACKIEEIAIIQVGEHRVVYPLIPSKAWQGWKLELFDLAESIPAHDHKQQKQFIIVVEGELIIHVGTEEQSIVRSGQMACIEPGVLHAINPVEKARFFTVDLPGSDYPEMYPLPILDEKYYEQKIDLGSYIVYELINGHRTEKKWSVALLEIHDSPKHFHRIEIEHFIVVHGTLAIEMEGQERILGVGESITTFPEKVHQLKSATKSPVRVLCFNFPAFDPNDMHVVE